MVEALVALRAVDEIRVPVCEVDSVIEVLAAAELASHECLRADEGPVVAEDVVELGQCFPFFLGVVAGDAGLCIYLAVVLVIVLIAVVAVVASNLLRFGIRRRTSGRNPHKLRLYRVLLQQNPTNDIRLRRSGEGSERLAEVLMRVPGTCQQTFSLGWAKPNKYTSPQSGTRPSSIGHCRTRRKSC